MTIYDPIADALGLEPLAQDYSQLNEDIILDPNISRQEAIARNKEQLTCNRCGVIGNGPNMLRWHFENCKREIKKCQQCGDDISMQGIKHFLYDQKKYCNRKCYTESKKGIIPIEMTKEVRKKISNARKGIPRKG